MLKGVEREFVSVIAKQLRHLIEDDDDDGDDDDDDEGDY